MDKLDASEIYPQRLNAKEVLTSKKLNFENSQPRTEQQNCLEEITQSENPLKGGDQPVRSDDLSGELQGGREGPQPTESKADAEARKDFCSSSIVITMNLEFNSMCRRKKTFTIPLKYIDGARATHTHLDVLQESRI